MAKAIKIWTGTEWVEVGIAAEDPSTEIYGGNANTVFSAAPINGGNAI